jgi:hypothetical protein
MEWTPDISVDQKKWRFDDEQFFLLNQIALDEEKTEEVEGVFPPRKPKRL